MRLQKLVLLFAAFGDFFACLDDTGGFSLPPVALLYEARPFAFNPPDLDLPAFLCQAGDLTS